MFLPTVYICNVPDVAVVSQTAQLFKQVQGLGVVGHEDDLVGRADLYKGQKAVEDGQLARQSGLETVAT